MDLGFRENFESEIVSTFHIVEFVDQLLLMDVISQLY